MRDKQCEEGAEGGAHEPAEDGLCARPSAGAGDRTAARSGRQHHSSAHLLILLASYIQSLSTGSASSYHFLLLFIHIYHFLNYFSSFFLTIFHHFFF